jgi:hypothetical protein
MRRERLVSVTCDLDLEGSLGALFSGLEFPFPGNGDRGRQTGSTMVPPQKQGPASGVAETILRACRRGAPLPSHEVARAWPPRTESRATFLRPRSPSRFLQGSCPCRLCGKSAAPNGDGRRDLIVRHSLRSGFLSWS